ncbi:MAG TPA: divalent metal cation transporter, partial [Burkholderiaceae bacterium]|nr:divalent metal cation transporter [Burkholderiaceae bacterium]
IAATAGGVLLDFTGIDPIKALFWSAVVNGVIAVPIMAVMMWIGARSDVLGRWTLTLRHRVLGWVATAAMAAAVLGMLVTALAG